jgi:hypothetical protein
MSRNAEPVNAIYALFGRGDVPAILARLAPDVAWEYEWRGERLKWFEQRAGRDAVSDFFADLRPGWAGHGIPALRGHAAVGMCYARLGQTLCGFARDAHLPEQPLEHRRVAQ